MTISVLNNDLDSDGPSGLTAVLGTDVLHGELHLAGDGTFTYTPDPQWWTIGEMTQDSFTYYAFDGQDYSDPATVTITVYNYAPEANPFDQDTFVNYPVDLDATGWAIDRDADSLTFSIAQQPAHGNVTHTPGTAYFLYTPAANFSGADTFTYRVEDGYGGWANGTIGVNVNKIETWTDLSVTNYMTVYGEPVTLTACVTFSTPVSGNAAGNVTFKDGATVLGNATLNANGTATLVLTSPLEVGSHSLAAYYLGSAVYLPSDWGASVDVAKADTNAALVIDPAAASSFTSLVGQRFDIDAYLWAVTPSANATRPTGSVTVTAVRDSDAAVFTLGSAGIGATYTAFGVGYHGYPIGGMIVDVLGAGNYTLTLRYDGDSHFNAVEVGGYLSVVTPVLSKAVPAACPVGPLKPGVVADPFAVSAVSSSGVTFAKGGAQVIRTDLSAGGAGPDWDTQWSWTNTPGTEDGLSGNGGTQTQAPRLEALNGTTCVAFIAGGSDYSFFDFYDGEYHARSMDGTTLVANGDGTFTIVDGSGQTFLFNDFGAGNLAGSFRGMAGAGGLSLAVAARDAFGRPTEIQKTSGVGNATQIESFVNTYVSSGVNAGRLETTTQRRKTGPGGWETVRSTSYTYYDGNQTHGNAGDLMLAVVRDGGNQAIDTSYYRYWTEPGDGGGSGDVTLMKMAFGAGAYARLTASLGASLDSLTDGQVAPFADQQFSYDDLDRVATAVNAAAGCSVCSSGQGTFSYSYSTNGDWDGLRDTNAWVYKTVETLPDANVNTVYCNADGQVVLKVYTEVSTSRDWAWYYRYDMDGRCVLSAEPSAVSGFDEDLLDLVDFGNAVSYLRKDAGLITLNLFGSETTAGNATPGDVAGYSKGYDVQQGTEGTPVPQSRVNYYSRTAGDTTTYHVANSTLFRNANGTGEQTTSYAYTWFSGTHQAESVTTTLPVVSAAQNGSGIASSVTTVFDASGRVTWTRDAAGVLSYQAYDARTGAVVKAIADVDTDNTGDFAGLPAGWSSPHGLHFVTTLEVDELGRATKQTDPDGAVTYTVYNDAAHEIRVYAAWDDATDAPTVPTVVIREDRALGYTEMLAMTATPALDGSGRPTGNEALSGLVSLSRTYVNNAGQTVAKRDYFNLAGLSYSTGAMGNGTAHFHETSYAYDNHGLPNKTVSPSGTIYRTVYDGLGRVVSEWVGTDDTPTSGFWSPTNLAGTNMVQVSAYEFDGGGVGDSLLTETTLFTHAAAAPDQTTHYTYDWRGRVVGSKAGVQVIEGTDVNRPITLFDYDNLNQTTRTRVYDGDGVALVDGNGTLQVPGSSLLRAQTHAFYDDLGRVYKSEVDNVNQANGTVGAYSLNAQTWYDERGLVRKQTAPGGAVSKSEYDALGRLTIAYTTDGQNDGNYTQALSVADDVVLEQTEYVYDAAGRVIQTISKQRFHDATGNGPLGNATGSQPKARVYNGGYFYDLAGRPTDTVNVGTNGNAAWTVPGSVPGRSDTVLVTSNSYGADGLVQDVTDAKGIVTRSLYDAFGRTLSTIEDFGGANKTTLYTYGPAGMTGLTAVNASTGNQTTEWVFGVTTAGGSGINSNDVVGSTRHPDPATGTASGNQTDTVTVSALGQTLSTTDRNGTVHAFSYDAVGRLTRDTATTLGNGIDGVVRQQEFRYDTLGQVALATQYDATTSGNVTSQVRREYNGFGQLTVEYQAIGGAVDLGNTPKVQYGYSEAANGTNHSRLVSMTYPDGRELDYAYGSANDTDDRISRLTAITDASGTLESYDYLGLATVVVRSHPQPGIDLSYVLRTPEAFGDAGDPYNGLDRFGRVVDQRWVDSGNGTAVDRFQYGYDRNSNRLWRDNLNNATFGELYAYDDLGQLVAFDRGTLDGNHTGTTGNATRSQSWDLDPLGNWDGVTTDGTTETREHNAQNEVVGVGNATLVFDAAGNMLTDEQGQRYMYDAWNRLVRVTDSGNATIAEYGYDALRRRTEETHGNATTELYYSADWQLLEERDAATGNTTTEYTWSPVYVDAMIERDRDTNGNGSLDERLWVQQDANWNVTSLANGTGAVVERYVYDAYGSVTIYSPTYGTVRGSSDYEFKQGYQSLTLDSITGLNFTNTRPYRSSLGRAISSDYLGLGPDVNSYRWEYGSPVNFVDPRGLTPIPLDKRKIMQWLNKNDAEIKEAVLSMNSLNNRITALHDLRDKFVKLSGMCKPLGINHIPEDIADQLDALADFLEDLYQNEQDQLDFLLIRRKQLMIDLWGQSDATDTNFSDYLDLVDKMKKK